jgi:hypothetical protein
MLAPDGVHVIDVSRIAALRQRLGRAAASLKVIGIVSAVAVALDGSRYVNGWIAFALGIVVLAMSFRVGKWLKSGKSSAASLVAVWLIAYCAWAVFASRKSFNADLSFYSILGLTIINLPVYFLVRGLLALHTNNRHLVMTGGSSEPLASNPWEDGSQGSRKHPKFLNKWSFRAYVFVFAAPLVWLFVAAASFNRPEPTVTDPAELAGRRTADVMVSVLVWLLMIYLYRRGRRHALIKGNELLKKDKRDVILYLRSFLDDGSIKLRAHANDGRIFPERFIKISFEELITDHAWRYGPVVAIGDPRSKEKLVPLGAARDFERDDTWRQTATDLMRRASMIVAVAGRAEGFLWELDTIVRTGLTFKLVLLLPPIDQRELTDRWSAMTQCAIGRHLPDVDLSRVRAVLVREDATVLITAHQRNDWAYETVLDTAAQLVMGISVVNWRTTSAGVDPRSAPRSNRSSLAS